MKNQNVVKFDEVDLAIKTTLMEADLHRIRENLHQGTFKSVDLVNFYGDRCQTVGRQLNLTAQEMFESALELAKKYDEERETAR